MQDIKANFAAYEKEMIKKIINTLRKLYKRLCIKKEMTTEKL